MGTQRVYPPALTASRCGIAAVGGEVALGGGQRTWPAVAATTATAPSVSKATGAWTPLPPTTERGREPRAGRAPWWPHGEESGPRAAPPRPLRPPPHGVLTPPVPQDAPAPPCLPLEAARRAVSCVETGDPAPALCPRAGHCRLFLPLVF